MFGPPLMLKFLCETELFRRSIFQVKLHYLVCEPTDGENNFKTTYKTLRKEGNHSCYNRDAKI